MEQSSYQEKEIFDNDQRYNLPNATAVLVLGIVSIVGCLCYGVVGTICGVIALILANKDMALYRAQPLRYTPSSYANLKAGRICAIIGLSLSALFLLAVIFFIAVVGWSALQHPEQWRYNQY